MLFEKDNGIMPVTNRRRAGIASLSNERAAPYARETHVVPASRFYVQFVDEKGRLCGFSAEETSKRILLVGGSGYGKTNVLYQTIDEVTEKSGNKVNIIFDSKGDFYRRYKTEDPEKEAVISHRRGYVSGVKWNVFSEILSASKEEQEITCRETAKLLLGNKYYQENRQKFFVDAAVEVLSVAMQVLLAEYYATLVMPTNTDLVRFLSLSPEMILERAEEYGYKEKIDLLISESQDGGYTGQTLGIMAEVKNVINGLFIGKFGSDSGNFSIRHEIQDCCGTKFIFIEYDVNHGKTLAPVYTCIITNAIKETLGRNRRNCKVNLFIDEWSLLERIPDMDMAISFGREPGLFIAAAFQHVGQIKEIYGAHMAEGMLSGFHNIIAFNAEDKDTRDYIRKRIGSAYRSNVHYASLSARTVSYAEEPIIRDEDITSLGIGEALVIPGTSKTITRFKFRNVKGE